jgi:hypothetical protein
MPKLNIFGLGSVGVDVDRSALQMDDNALRLAQNAVPSQGSRGGIRKRPPLVKFDNDVAAGSIGGFIGAPLGPGPSGVGTDDQTTYFVTNNVPTVNAPLFADILATYGAGMWLALNLRTGSGTPVNAIGGAAGTLAGSTPPTWASGLGDTRDGTLKFNGTASKTSSYLDFGAGYAKGQNLGAFTVAARIWVATVGDLRALMERWAGVQVNLGGGWLISPFGYVKISDGGSFPLSVTDIDSVTTFPVGQWVIAILTWNGSNAYTNQKIYRNGVLRALTTVSPTSHDADGVNKTDAGDTFYVGRASGSYAGVTVGCLTGWVDWIFAWDYVLTPQFIAQLTGAGPWFTSRDSFGTAAVTSTLQSSPSVIAPSVMAGEKLYYLSSNTVRVFDGIQDDTFSILNSAYTLTRLASGGGKLYVATLQGVVFELDAVGRIRQIGAALPTAHLPQAMAVHQNQLFAVAYKAATVSKVYRIPLTPATTDTTAWTLDYTETVTLTDGLSDFNDLASYNGLLYLASGMSSGGSGGQVYVRSGAGVWTVVAGSGGGVASVGLSFATFKGQLYVAEYKGDATQALNDVRRLSATGSNFQEVFSDPTATPPRTGQLYVAGNKLFYLQAGRTYLHYTTDGTTWTKSATLSGAIGAGFGFFTEGGATGSIAGRGVSSFVLLQAGTALQLINQAGTLLTLTLPPGVFLDSTRPPRFTIYDRFVIVTNSPNRPITVDVNGIVRLLSLTPPSLAVTLSSGGAGNLTGVYKVRQTFLIRDADGNVISESDMGPVMLVGFNAAGQLIQVGGVNLSLDGATDSRLYRTTAGGDVYFFWLEVNGNTQTASIADDTLDAALSLIAAPVLGTAPHLSLVSSWRGRVWGVDRVDTDYLAYTEAGSMYAWGINNRLLIGRKGSDSRGITALIPRRDALGVGRREGLFQVTGTSNSNFTVVTLSEHCGVESQETVKVFRDVAYFLWKDGVYRWGPTGIDCLSDGKVRSWFVTDTYFNRARFQFAFAHMDTINNKYRLFLASPESQVEDRWVEYDFQENTWWGPHKWDRGIALTSAGGTADSNDRYVPLIGSADGYLWKPGTVAGLDDTATGIAFLVDTKRHDGLTPDIEKTWLQLSLLSKIQASGSLLITPYVGGIDAPAGTVITADLTKGREKLPRLGVGKHVGFTFAHSVVGEDCEISGYELPFYELGRR